MGLCMEAIGAQNSAHANIESRSAPARSFRSPGRVKNDREVIMLSAFCLGVGKSSIEV